MKILRTAGLGSNFTGSYKKRVHFFNSLVTNDPNLNPLKTPENQVFWGFQGVKNGSIGQKWVNIFF